MLIWTLVSNFGGHMLHVSLGDNKSGITDPYCNIMFNVLKSLQ